MKDDGGCTSEEKQIGDQQRLDGTLPDSRNSRPTSDPAASGDGARQRGSSQVKEDDRSGWGTRDQRAAM